MTPPTAALPLKDWLKEREANCLRIAKTKTSYDKAGWLEDASYFSQCIEQLSRAPAVQATADEAIKAAAKECADIMATYCGMQPQVYYKMIDAFVEAIRKAVSPKAGQVLNSAGFLGTEFGPHPRPRGPNALSPMNPDAPWSRPVDPADYKWRCPFCNEAVATCSLQRDHIQGCHDFPAVTREPTLYIIVRRGRIITNHYLHREAADEGAAKLGGEVIALFTSLAAVSGKQEKER